MNNLKNNEITQQKIKELKIQDLMMEFTSPRLHLQVPFQTVRLLIIISNVKNYNTKWTYKAKFEVTL
jgi:hypothetical protein